MRIASPFHALTKVTILGSLLTHTFTTSDAMADESKTIHALVEKGEFAAAEQLLRGQIPNPESPITDDAAIQLEILRRTRYDFSLDEAAVLSQIRPSISDVTSEDLRRWREADQLQHRVIDGEVRYFRRAVSNLYRFSEEARQRRDAESPPDDSATAPGKFDLTKHIEQLVALGESSSEVEISPIHHYVTYTLTIDENHPRVKTGAIVKVWLPFAQAYRQQRDVKLLDSQPPVTLIAKNLAPHRTLYFEQEISDASAQLSFRADFEFVTSAYYPQLDPARVEPYDPESDLVRQYTSEREPHIVFTPEVRRLAAEIVGDETNPLRKAILVFRWVSENIPWCGEMEYCIIPNLSAKGLAARRGDCGVQGMTFITLCRAAGVPARWQSGWETKPGAENMHDWSEFYVEPWGWLPADASYGVRKHDDPRVQNFLCGHMDPYRLIVNLDYARPLQPEKTSFRSEPNDFQRGEVEINGHNLYFDEWTYNFEVQTRPAD